MENKQLLEQSARLGYPLLEGQESFDVNKALADVVKSKNYRFYEGFPVMLANAAQDKDFNFQKVEALLKNKKDKDLLHDLFLLSWLYLRPMIFTSMALLRKNKLIKNWDHYEKVLKKERSNGK